MTRPVAIVTGASRGIGRAIACRLAQEGYRVAVAARSLRALDELVRELDEGLSVATDVSNPTEVDHLVKAVLERWGRIDVLVNNAGLGHVGSVEATTPEVFDQVMAVNVKGPFLCTRAVLPTMRARSSGHVVNILSVAAKRAFPEWSAYTASKFALDGFGKALAEELKGSGIRVTALYPGATDTPLWDAIGMADVARKGLVLPDDVAAAVAFALAQPARTRVAELVIEPAKGDL